MKSLETAGDQIRIEEKASAQYELSIDKADQRPVGRITL
jgi:hypothetical protein